MSGADTFCSVIIPTYCRPELTRRAVESVLAQRDVTFEVLVVEDGSPASQAFSWTKGDCRVRVVHQDNKGVSAARNTGIRLARGVFLAFLDSDDTWMPEKLSRQVAFMQSHPALLLCHCDEVWIRNGRRVNPRVIHRKARGWEFEQCLAMCRISPSAALMRAVFFERVGLFDEALPVCEDFDIWLRYAARNEIGYLDQALVQKFAGFGDHLSQSQPAMDRYRIYALGKLLCTASLAPEQERLVKQEILRKIDVLESGARKRHNSFFVEKLSSLRGAIVQSQLSSNTLQFLLEPSILERGELCR